MEIRVIDLGRISYKEAFTRQIQAQAQILQGISSHTLILCEHHHTVTLSRHASLSNILDQGILKSDNIDFIMGVNRGGDITYHGPGQLVGYLIFDLRELGRDLGWFLNRTEEVLIKTLSEFQIEGHTKKGFRGIWIGEKKIASIGIGVSKWVSMHGFALNINTDLKLFNKIRPCGLDVKMTSMEECLGGPIDMRPVKQVVVSQMASNFSTKQYSYAKGVSDD
ncbi:lipoyl(octanoyl) transferase LipB [Candidatus Omnitrophota bacterium]